MFTFLWQAVQSNVENAALLADRVNAIMLVILTSLQGIGEKDVPNDLKTSVSRLTRDLRAIEIDMQRIKKRTDTSHISSIFKATLKYGDNAALITKCVGRLDWAMQLFQVEARIQDSVRLAQVATTVEEVRVGVQSVQMDARSTRIGVQQVQEGVRDISVDVKDIQALVHEITGRATRPEASLPSIIIPPKPELFYGRDNVVEDIVLKILAPFATRYGVLGPGGIGKTSVVSAVMQHPDTARHFESRRYWAPCEQASSIELLHAILAKVFQIQDGSSDRVKAILSRLESDTRQHLIVLDNFETPWDIEGHQSDVLDTLCAISAVSNLTILITMRGSLPGTTRMKWTKPELLPLAALLPDAARELFTQVSPESGDDRNLDSLLAALDYMPLAVTLMAKVGSEGETPTELLERWRSEGTDLIHEEGGDRRTSVNKSIELSLQSNLMRNNPEALVLLSILLVLPGGARPDIISGLVPSISRPSKARAVLLRASLVYTVGATHILRVLSPISSYITRRHPLPPELWRSIHDFYIKYSQEHASDSRNPSFPNDIQALALEEANLEEVLLHALHHDLSIQAVKASYYFSYYLYWTTPRSNIIMAAVTASESLESYYWLFCSLQLLGDINYKQNQYNAAEEYLNRAREVALSAGDESLAAHCFKSLGDIERSRNQYDEARKMYKERRQAYSRLGDTVGALLCVLNIAEVDAIQGQFHVARSTYQEALGQSQQLGNSYHVACCQSELAHIDCVQGYYDSARTGAGEGLQGFDRLSYVSGGARCLTYSSEIDLGQERYDDARVIAERACQEWERSGDHTSAINCSLNLVMVAMEQARYNDARTLLDEAEGVEGVDSSLCWGKLYQRLGQFADAKSAIQKAHSRFERIGCPQHIAECVCCLGDIDLMEGRLDDARGALEEAQREFKRMGMRKGIASCLMSLGEINLKEGRYGEARTNLEQARRMFAEMSAMVSLARCVSLLGDIPPSARKVAAEP
ncbi:hypothetical protein FRB97_002189 [Tulasnella sp. 331]|nr:hypothetical protein FRB97_002189 [Tulasnella sp. 331]